MDFLRLKSIQSLENSVWTCGAMDNASDYGSEDSRFESWQVRMSFYAFIPWSCDYETDALSTALPRLLGTSFEVIKVQRCVCVCGGGGV